MFLPFLCRFSASRMQKVATVGLAPQNAVKRGALSTPGSARPRSPPPLTHEGEERPQEWANQGSGENSPQPQAEKDKVPRSQEPEETVLALGAINPAGDVNMGARRGPAGSRWVTSRKPLKRQPRQSPTGKGWLSWRTLEWMGGSSHPGVKPRCSGPTLKTQRGGPGSS